MRMFLFALSRLHRSARPVVFVAGILFGLGLAAMSASVGSAAAAERAILDVENAGRYGRMVLDFPDLNILPKHTIRSSNGVLVLEFDTEVEVDVSRVPVMLPSYVTIARGDPANRGARFALARGVRVNTMEAGPKLFVDFLPSTWQGPPPRLPEEVVAELARRAEEAAKRAREAEFLKKIGDTEIRLDLRAAEAPTFTRLVFGWNVPFEASLKRNGRALSVSFNRFAKVDLSPFNANPPKFVRSIEEDKTAPDGVGFRLQIPADADVRAFRDDMAYVIDIQGITDEADEDPVARLLDAAKGAGLPSVQGGTEVVNSPGESGPAPMPAVAPATVAPAAPAPAAVADASAPVEAPDPIESLLEDRQEAPTAEAAPAAMPAPVESQEDAAPQAGETASADPAPVVSSAPADEEVAAAAPVPSAPAVPPQPAPVVGELPESGTVTLTDPAVQVEAKRIGRATRLVFRYRKPVASAMFTRNASLWLLFDDTSPLNVETVQQALAGMATAIEVLPIDGAQVLKITLAEPLLATLNPDNTFWVVTIGDMVTQPTRPLQVRRAIREDGSVALEIPFGPANGLHQIVDPAVGDTIMVVSAMGPPRGLTKPQVFAEVDALSSGHGLAFIRKADDVQILVRDPVVSIERPEGLSVSTAVPVERASILDLPAAMGVQPSDRQAYLDLAPLEAKDPPTFFATKHEINTELSRAQSKDDRVRSLYKLAEFHLANGLGSEALGALDLIGSIAAEEATAARMAMMRAAANATLGRWRDVVAAVDRPDFADHPEAAVWRSIALAELGDYPAARRNFPRAEVAVGRYPVAVQNQFLLNAVKTSIELNDFGKARSLMAQINPSRLTENQRAAIDLLNARAADASGFPSEALDLLTKAVQNGKGPVEAEAIYRLVNLQRREGLITPEQAANRLEELAVAWRGDELELKTLRTLGQLSVEQGNYRRAFELMRVANMVDPQSEVTRLMQEEMQAAFGSLFLDGKTTDMAPIDALALYYDFRELTPLGKRGDEMVRNLANRLVEVDLLPQAAELLAYQVDNRLRGAAKAKVAADLALVYLLDGRPERALTTLSRTRQAELPVAIERQRRLVEARALTSVGKPDLALELVSPLSGSDVERLKAEILWSAQRYGEAGEQFERMLGGRWSEDLPLDEREQNDVLRAAVAYALTQDQLSLDRLRSKFEEKMAATSNAPAFRTLIAPVEGAGGDFNAIVQAIVAADSKTSFLEEYRRRYLSAQSDDRPRLVEQPLPDDMKSLEVPGTPAKPAPEAPSANIEPDMETAPAGAVPS